MSYEVYRKRSGTLSLSTIKPKMDDKGFPEKDGAILVQMVPHDGEGNRKWSERLSFALSPDEIFALGHSYKKGLIGADKPLSFLHDQGKRADSSTETPAQDIKTLRVQKDKEGTGFWINLQRGEEKLGIHLSDMDLANIIDLMMHVRPSLVSL
jgi:hypothetical protein